MSKGTILIECPCCGSAHGNIRYELQPDFVHEIYKPIVDNAIKRVLHVKE